MKIYAVTKGCGNKRQDFGNLTAEFDFAGSGVHTFDNRKGL